MRPHDPHRPDHRPQRARRQTWAFRLAWLSATLALLTIILPVSKAVAWVAVSVVFMICLTVILLMIPWESFRQPEEPDDDDPEMGAYPQ